jgi:apolipoprotein D and lipocalin family protein
MNMATPTRSGVMVRKARRLGQVLLMAWACMGGLPAPADAQEQTAKPEANNAQAENALPALKSLPQLDAQRYMGLWYQVALFPNRFQAQCVSDTTATYRLLPGNVVEVLNRCRTASGQMDDALGQARPVGGLVDGQLRPAQLQVSFLPAWLRWTGVGWGDYWVVQLASDYRYAVVSEPSRRFLWVLSRSPRLRAEDETAIRAALQAQGFDLGRLQAHPHG